jgi:16S rRNA (adenine1518-N6/adenine1519-N6)-dimethyltransferase
MAHRAKKSLGQHFLRSKSAIRSIVEAGFVTAADTVLEIGPGEGVLTQALLDTGATVVAVEKDRDLIPLLTETFAEALASKQLTLIEGDILDFDPAQHGLMRSKYKLVANIPYYITGAIFEKFLSEKNSPSSLVVLIQKEVATRIVARDNKESILSISVKAFGTPKLTAKVPASAFRPAPKVDSAVLAVYNISQDSFSDWGMDEVAATKRFFTIVRGGFAHKRKLLARNLEIAAEKSRIQETFATLGLSPNTRAEDITLDTWITLAKTLGSL